MNNGIYNNNDLVDITFSLGYEIPSETYCEYNSANE